MDRRFEYISESANRIRTKLQDHRYGIGNIWACAVSELHQTSNESAVQRRIEFLISRLKTLLGVEGCRPGFLCVNRMCKPFLQYTGIERVKSHSGQTSRGHQSFAWAFQALWSGFQTNRSRTRQERVRI